MKLTTQSEYALLALIYIARQQSNQYCSIEVISKAQNIPRSFLVHILNALRRAQFLKSSQGKYGGYALAKAPHQISLAEVVRLLDGPLAPTASVSKYFYKPTPIEKEAKLVVVFTKIRNCIADVLEQTSLADIV